MDNKNRNDQTWIMVECYIVICIRILFITNIFCENNNDAKINGSCRAYRFIIQPVFCGIHAYFSSFFDPDLPASGGIPDNEFGLGKLQRKNSAFL